MGAGWAWLFVRSEECGAGSRLAPRLASIRLCCRAVHTVRLTPHRLFSNRRPECSSSGGSSRAPWPPSAAPPTPTWRRSGSARAHSQGRWRSCATRRSAPTTRRRCVCGVGWGGGGEGGGGFKRFGCEGEPRVRGGAMPWVTRACRILHVPSLAYAGHRQHGEAQPGQPRRVQHGKWGGLRGAQSGQWSLAWWG